MKKILILEDSPYRVQWFYTEFFDDVLVVTNDAEEAKRLLCNTKFDLIFLDHDLGGEAFVDSNQSNTGWQVAEVIPRTPNRDTNIVVHSLNPGGTKRMVEHLKKHPDYTGQVTKAPFGTWKKI